VYSKPVRLVVKIPKSPEALGLTDPYPQLGGWWLDNAAEWCWHIPSDLADSLDLPAVLEIAQTYQTPGNTLPDIGS
jgi:hypothetical protein